MMLVLLIRAQMLCQGIQPDSRVRRFFYEGCTLSDVSSIFCYDALIKRSYSLMPNQLPSGDDVNHIPTVPPAGSNTITPGTCENSFICTAKEKNIQSQYKHKTDRRTK